MSLPRYSKGLLFASFPIVLKAVSWPTLFKYVLRSGSKNYEKNHQKSNTLE